MTRFTQAPLLDDARVALGRDAPRSRRGLGPQAARPASRPAARGRLAEMRALIFELRPGNLEQDGLTSARLRTPHGLLCRAGSGSRSSSRAPLRSGCHWPSRRSSTGSRRKHCTNVVKHGRRAAGPGRNWAGSRAAFACGSATMARASIPLAVPDGPPGPGRHARARAAKIDARFLGQRASPGDGTTIEVVVPNVALGRPPVRRHRWPTRPPFRDG